MTLPVSVEVVEEELSGFSLGQSMPRPAGAAVDEVIAVVDVAGEELAGFGVRELLAGPGGLTVDGAAGRGKRRMGEETSRRRGRPVPQTWQPGQVT